MALAAPPLAQSNGLIDLLKQKVPLQERALEIYQRLLAINELAAAMNSAQDIEQLQFCLARTFQGLMPEESVRLCIVEGNRYRRLRMSGPETPHEEGNFPIGLGLVGRVLQSGNPLWIRDTLWTGNEAAGTTVLTDTPRTVILLPFAALGKVIGVLELVSSRPDRFDEIEYHLLFLVTAHLSSSLENILTRQELATANARLKDHDLRLTQLNQQLRLLAHTDEATGLYNKRRLFEQLNAEIARARRYGEILSCLMIDIDDFKRINDTYGHQTGDEALQQIGAILKQSLRITDFVARYGGEEFTVLLPRTDRHGAQRVAESIRMQLRSRELVTIAARLHVTVSIGIACCTKFDRLDAQQIILFADNALYRAKGAGKDRVCLSDEIDHSHQQSQFFVNPPAPIDTNNVQ
jgi:diguanylate cyclase (GGDEF)-like protein